MALSASHTITPSFILFTRMKRNVSDCLGSILFNSLWVNTKSLFGISESSERKKERENEREREREREKEREKEREMKERGGRKKEKQSKKIF